jgi:hypothetical protein
MRQLYLSILISILLAALTHNYSYGQRGEGVNWATPVLFSANKIVFRSDKITAECNNCKCYEIRTSSGITGLFVSGEGTFKIASKSMSDKTESCMMRFNPKEFEKYVQITGRTSIKDEQFKNDADATLKKIFGHCYHSGMDALIPTKGEYALDMYSEKYGDLLASFSNKEDIVFSFSYKKKY